MKNQVKNIIEVILIEQDLPHYRIGIFNKLNKAVGGGLTVYSPENDKSRFFLDSEQEVIHFERRRINGRLLFGGRLYFSNLFQVLWKNKRPDVVILRHSVRNPILLPFLIYCRIVRLPAVVWGQGFSRHRRFRPFRNPFDFLGLLIVRLADSYVAYSPMVKETLNRYVNTSRVSVAANTINLEPLDPILEQLKAEGKASVKRSLGLKKNQYLVFIGRLQKRKRIDFLLDAYARMTERRDDVGLIVIGDGPEKTRLEKTAKEILLGEIRFIGALDFAESAPYLFASDVMVIPGWLGLAVNHGFYFGLPVVTCKGEDDGSGHPPEIEWLEPGVTGIVSKADDADEFARDICEALRRSSEMGVSARKYFHQNLQIGRMIDGFIKGIEIAQAGSGRKKKIESHNQN